MDHCVPRKSFKCWRFRKDGTDVPRWVLQFLTTYDDGSLGFQEPDNGPQHELEDGDWIVLFPEERAGVFTKDEFSELFEACPGSAS